MISSLILFKSWVLVFYFHASTKTWPFHGKVGSFSFTFKGSQIISLKDDKARYESPKLWKTDICLKISCSSIKCVYLLRSLLVFRLKYLNVWVTKLSTNICLDWHCDWQQCWHRNFARPNLSLKNFTSFLRPNIVLWKKLLSSFKCLCTLACKPHPNSAIDFK